MKIDYNFERFFKLSSELHCITGLDGYIKHINPSFDRVLGWSHTDVSEQPFINFVHPDDLDDTLRVFDDLEKAYATLSFDARYRCKKEDYRAISWRAYPDNRAGLLYAVGVDVTEVTELQKNIADMASIDEVTGVQNRQSFSRHIDSDIQLMHRVGKPLSLLLIDVDYFRQLHEMHGEREGENVLRIIARNLRGAIRSTDVIARVDSEAFGIILPNTSYDDAKRMGEKCRKAVQSYTWNKHTITVSIGTSTIDETDVKNKYSRKYPHDYHQVLFNEAKYALHAARGSGRNRVMHFDDLKQG